MIAILSPAKSIIESANKSNIKLSEPVFYKQSNSLVSELKKMSVDELSVMYKSSLSIAHLNFTRMQNWINEPFNDRSLPAILAYIGEVYRGLEAESFNAKELKIANEKIRILSGLYGVLKPLDVILPYRLEMGSKWGGKQNSTLYEVWTEKVTDHINKTISESDGDKVLLNLASNEYFKVIDKKKLNYPILTIDFKEERGGVLRNITVYTKKARGLMAKFIIDFNINNVEDIKAFNYEGYLFSSEHSNDKKWIFIR